MRFKEFVGIVAVAVLLGIIGAIVAPAVGFTAGASVKGSPHPLAGYMGHWCGHRSDPYKSTHMYLDFESDYGELDIKLDKKMQCTASPKENSVSLSCDNDKIQLKASLETPNRMVGQWAAGTDSGTFELQQCD